jgi:hypothetical protein
LEGCPCEGLEGWDLAVCLAPPRGEYELEYPIGSGAKVVVSREGVFLRQLRPPEDLPFMETIERRVDPESVLAPRRITAERVVCDAIRALRAAAESGSRLAAGLLEACRGLVEEVESGCRVNAHAGQG